MAFWAPLSPVIGCYCLISVSLIDLVLYFREDLMPNSDLSFVKSQQFIRSKLNEIVIVGEKNEKNSEFVGFSYLYFICR